MVGEGGVLEVEETGDAGEVERDGTVSLGLVLVLVQDEGPSWGNSRLTFERRRRVKGMHNDGRRYRGKVGLGTGAGVGIDGDAVLALRRDTGIIAC